MKRLLRLLLLSAPLLGMATVPFVSSKAHADSITVGLDDESYPPFYSKGADGKWHGWELDMLAAVCAQMKTECKTKEISWDGLVPALQQKQIDMVWASMTINGERRKVIDFTHFYYNSAIVMIGSKDDPTKVDCGNLASFNGKVIGVQAGTIFSSYMQAAPHSVQVKTYDTVDNALADLSSGRIDYVQEGISTFATFLAKNADYVVKTTCPGNDILGYGVGGGLRKGDDALNKKVSDAILALAANGTWDAITAKYPEIKGLITKP
ncbi:transporter substrate-binding domain-containing protein [Acidisoma cellulosilytica]|uniref:Transporter substrate-binding domain-containing protein n=1 Tax=Acidisoma cellulosilyticum TaxID=2802395 RepID=A0A963YZH3_9PROT|nr:transporter substrate-binding domain-containing protein [Acidisoma cellulosilyticum]MCB8879038.1 transporter substrate-binding domain-containing protein [Acidisoma cellulosilyticum]